MKKQMLFGTLAMVGLLGGCERYGQEYGEREPGAPDVAEPTQEQQGEVARGDAEEVNAQDRMAFTNTMQRRLQIVQQKIDALQAEIEAKGEQIEADTRQGYRETLQDLRQEKQKLQDRVQRFDASAGQNWNQFKNDVNDDLKDLGKNVNDAIDKMNAKVQKLGDDVDTWFEEKAPGRS